MCKAMIMGTHSVTHPEKNECYTVPVPMLPTGSPVEWGPMYKIAWLELIHLKSYKQINLPILTDFNVSREGRKCS